MFVKTSKFRQKSLMIMYCTHMKSVQYIMHDVTLTSLRYELCSGMKSLCRVWTEAVAEFFSEWRALMSWLRGTIIWQIHKTG